MLRPGDRVLVGLSGGKDSMTLLLQLLRLQAVAPVWFEVGAVTVDPQFPGFNPAPLAAWCEALGVPHFFEALPVLALAEAHMDADSLCAFCARLKRGLLYSAARREGYNVLALGQHLDDLAESFLMSAFRNGVLRTMKAHYVNDEGDVRVIRPLALLREADTRAYAAACALPVIPDTCPACFSGPTARYAAKRLLAREEAAHPTLFASLREALRPLMTTEGHSGVLAAAGATPGHAVLAAAPAGWAPAELVEGWVEEAGGDGGADRVTDSPPGLGGFDE
jgi:tRNA 2-thiocytidine biosynthesis protein TtcA